MTDTGSAGTVEWPTGQGDSTLKLGGDWTLAHYSQLRERVRDVRTRLPEAPDVDLSELGALDTAGASLLAELVGAERIGKLVATLDLSPERRALVQTVANAVAATDTLPPPRPPSALIQVLERIGRTVLNLRRQVLTLLGFIGLILETLFRTVFQPRRWRITSLVHHLEQTGLDAVPIVALLSFLVGAVIAFLGATVLASYGASIYTVDLVSYSFLREFGVLLAAILLAGRTASAFTAQLGSMKAREEIDAIQTLGLDPIELLVLPRVLALVLALPMLTFLAMIAGILGGAAVCVLALHISPAMFLSMFQADTELRHFWVGLSKAPIFAFLIAVIGCVEGFKVSGSAESVGQHTTSSVVQSIFVVIVVDAMAALFFMEMNW